MRYLLTSAFVLLFHCAMVVAEQQKVDIEKVALELANPNTGVSSVTLKFQHQNFTGDLPRAGQQSASSLVIQAALPYFLDSGGKVILRPSLTALVEQPVSDAANNNFKSEQGLGDIGFDLSYTPMLYGNKWYAFGIVGLIPSATVDSLGSDRWAVGPGFRIGLVQEDRIFSIYPSHQWDVGGSGKADINLTNLQITATHLPGGGWSYGSSTQVFYDHEREEWTLPLNVSFGRTVLRNGKPMKFGLELNYYLEQADAFGPQWMVSLNISPVVKKSRRKLFKRLPCTSASGC